nr:MAG TPA: hypothetical protein [Caudoviricetes sp.]
MARIRAFFRTVTEIAQNLVTGCWSTKNTDLCVFNTNAMLLFKIRAVIIVHACNPSRQYNSPPVYYSARMSL